MIKKILILGAKGNLGSEFVKLLSAYNVLAVDRDELNICDHLVVANLIAKFLPEVIINCAAYNNVDLAETERELALALNGLAVKNLGELAVKHNCILIHYSSDYVFGGDNQLGYRENDIVCPINVYGESKTLGEQALLAIPNLKYYLIRTSKLFGPETSGKPSFFSVIYQKAITDKVLNLVDAERACFTYTPDLAAASWDLVLNGLPFGIYHLVNSGTYTWKAAGELMVKLCNLAVEINSIVLDRLAKRPQFSELLNTKTKQLRPLETALWEYLKINDKIKI